MKLILITLVAVVVGMMVACAGESEEEVYLTEVAEWYKENILEEICG